MRNRRKLFKTIYDFWCIWYSKIISITFAAILLFLQYKYDLKIWDATNYADMLTAIITFLSIVIGIFGILIPMIVSAKNEKNSMAEYFFEKADIKYFTKCMKSIFSSGMLSLICVCILYLEDIVEEVFLKWFLSFTVCSFVYFCCNAYRFIGIMINLLIRRRKNENSSEGTSKTYKKPKTEDEIKKINNQIRQNKKF